MQTYFTNLIPQILSFSKKLDSSSILINHHWTLIDGASSEKTVFIFRSKDNQLLISRNGNVEKGNWELIDHNTLLIDSGLESRMFKHGFADDSVLALKGDGKSEYAFLVDENIIPESAHSIEGIVNYLKIKYRDDSNERLVREKVVESEKNCQVKFLTAEERKMQDKFAFRILISIIIIISIICFFAFLYSGS